jgi:hypothetical protein
MRFGASPWQFIITRRRSTRWRPCRTLDIRARSRRRCAATCGWWRQASAARSLAIFLLPGALVLTRIKGRGTATPAAPAIAAPAARPGTARAAAVATAPARPDLASPSPTATAAGAPNLAASTIPISADIPPGAAATTVSISLTESPASRTNSETRFEFCL